MIKSRFDTERVSVKIGLVFSRFGISPNTWTVMSLIPAVLGFITLVVFQNLPVSLFFFILSGGIDAIDGAVARVTRSISALGAFLDGVIDRYVEILLYTGLLFYLFHHGDVLGIPNPFLICLLIFGALMPTYIRAYAHHRGVVTDPTDQRRMGGILERPERLTLIYIGMFLGSFDVIWLVCVIALTAFLANITAFQRLWFVVSYAEGDI